MQVGLVNVVKNSEMPKIRTAAKIPRSKRLPPLPPGLGAAARTLNRKTTIRMAHDPNGRYAV